MLQAQLKLEQETYRAAMAAGEEIRMKYQGKPQDMPGDELERWRAAVKDADAATDRIGILQQQIKAEAFGKLDANAFPVTARDDRNGGTVTVVRQAFREALAVGLQGLNQEQRRHVAAYQSDNPVGGGYMTTPPEVATEILTLLKDDVFIRRLARIETLTSAESLEIGAIDTDPSDATWTTELSTGSEETTMAFGKRVLKPEPVAKRIKLSNTLLRKSRGDLEAEVMDRLSYKFGITEEKAFLTGTGQNQPLGVFSVGSAANLGISTARDFTAANNNKVIADDFWGVYFKLKSAARRNAQWVFHRLILQAIRTAKDSNNNYVWASGLGPGGGMQGMPPTLCGLPYNESEYAPSTQTTGLYTAILGDFSRYVIVDALDMQLKVLDQLYAENNQMGYILRKETDGAPVMEEAFARLKLA